MKLLYAGFCASLDDMWGLQELADACCFGCVFWQADLLPQKKLLQGFVCEACQGTCLHTVRQQTMSSLGFPEDQGATNFAAQGGIQDVQAVLEDFHLNKYLVFTGMFTHSRYL